MRQLAGFSKDPKTYICPEIYPGYMSVSSEIPHILTPLSVPLHEADQNQHTSCRTPATKGKAGRVIEASSEDEEGEERQRPLEPLVLEPGPSLFSPGYLLSDTTPILPSWIPAKDPVSGKIR